MVRFVLLSVAALALFGAGLAGYLSLVPALAHPVVTWTLIAAGVVVDVAAVLGLLVSRARARRLATPPE